MENSSGRHWPEEFDKDSPVSSRNLCQVAGFGWMAQTRLTPIRGEGTAVGTTYLRRTLGTYT
jgi:hypothetical protein